MIQKIVNYESSIKKMLPWVKALDPELMRDFSQYLPEMENVCFTEPPLVLNEQSSQLNIASHKDTLTDIKPKERSKTPDRDRSRSLLGMGKSTKS
jgi:hypothetical protein